MNFNQEKDQQLIKDKNNDTCECSRELDTGFYP